MTDIADRIARLTDAQRALLARRLGLTPADTAGPATMDTPAAEPVAVVGMGCRLPGGVDSPAELWEALRTGRDLISEVPEERWSADEWFHPDPGHPGTVNNRRGGFLPDVRGFDHRFFGISADEAAQMDPQQRLLLETAYTALEDAGIPPASLAGSRTGVYMAAIMDDYAWMLTADPDRIDVHTGTGTQRSILANRLSYLLDLRGPSVAVDSACSSSLLAVHLACQSIRTGESDLAIAGGVNVMATPVSSVIYAKLGVLAPDGRCKTFDARANGFVRGEGSGVVILKRLSAAVRDGDPIWAVVRGSASGQDGRTSNITTPNGPAQTAVIRAALAQAGVEPREISLVETHGTGTPLGDPLELEALAAAIGTSRQPGDVCLLGAVKTNLGHLEAAAGVVGLIKTALSLTHRMVPPVLHHERLNPRIDLAAGPFAVPTAPTPLPAGYAGVSSFGFGGSIAHAILAPAPPVPATPTTAGPRLILVTARTATALRELATSYADQLDRGGTSLADLSYTALRRRDHHPHRAAVVAQRPDEAAAMLRKTSAPEPAVDEARVAMVFPGQGTLAPGTAAELYRESPVFRSAALECDALFRSAADWSPVDALSGTSVADWTDTRHSQAALFTIQVGLTALWRSWGLDPAVIVGQSLGEVAAAHAAGALDLGDAVRVVVERARVMATLTGRGASAMVELSIDAAREVAGRSGLAVAGQLGPTTTMLAGPPGPLRELVERLTEEGTFAQALRGAQLAYHSPQMAAVAPDLAAALAGIRPRPARIPMVSTVTGAPVDTALDGGYWARNLADPFLLPAAVDVVTGRGVTCWLEVSPHGVLRRAINAGEPRAVVLPSLVRGEPELRRLLGTAGELLTRGVRLDPAALAPTGRVARLPGYPWQHEPAWLPERPARAGRRPVAPAPESVAPPAPESVATPAPEPDPVAEPVAPPAPVSEPVAEPVATPAPAPEPVGTPAPEPVAVTAAGPAGPPDRSGSEFADDIELALRQMWAELLMVDPEQIGPRTSFFDLHGDSLKGFALVRRISEDLAVRIPMDAMAGLLNIRDMADHIRAAKGLTPPVDATDDATPDDPTPVDPAPDDETLSDEGAAPADADRFTPFPLLPIQRAYWVGKGLDLGVAAHHYLEYESTSLDLHRLERAWNRLVRRHEMLRAVLDPDGQQRILPSVPRYRIEVLDLTTAGADERDAAIAQLRDRLTEAPRSSHEWPLFEVHATRLPGGATRIHLGVDMLVCDGRSFAILSEEWRTLYEWPETSLPPLDLSFRDVVPVYHAGGPDRDRADAYWRPRLAELPGPPQLPWARQPGELDRPRYRRRSARLDPERWRRLRAAGARAGLGASALLLAAYSEVLGTWSSDPSFCVNVTTFNLRNMLGSADRIVGDFTSTVPVAVNASAAGTLTERARLVQRRLWADLEHVGRSGVEIVAEANALRTDNAFRLGIPYVFTSLLTGDGGAEPPVPFSWLGRRTHSVAQTPQVLMDLHVMHDAGDLVIDFDIVDDMFPAGLPDALFDTLLDLLTRLADDPAAWQTGPLALMPGNQLPARRAANSTDAPVPVGGLHEPFVRQARRQPDRVAVRCGDRALDYGEVDRASEHVAEVLEHHGVRRGDVVAVAMRKGWEQVVGVLGVLKAGAAYLPVDPDLPADRRRHLVERTGAAVVLTQPDLTTTLDLPAGIAVVPVDATGAEPRDRPAPAGDDPAYVIYTSGSTGSPKGVVVHHRAALNTILDVNARFGVADGDVVLGLSSLSFDLSVYDVFGTLAAGATLVLPAPDREHDPAGWADLVRRHRVTLWNSVPALYGLYVDHLETVAAAGDRAPDLRTVLLSGDWIPLTLPDRSRAVLPDAELVSLGGATEAAVWSIHHRIGEVDPAWPSIPYGRPLTNQRFHVVNAAGRPCPDWVTGQLHIAGVGLATGYLGDPAATRAAFAVDPHSGERRYRTGDMGRYRPDGTIEFLGRRDDQVKVQGHRIELGEIEAALLSEPDVTRAAVVVLGPRDGRRSLAAHVVVDPAPPAGAASSSDAATPEDTIRDRLAARLPRYMVPTVIRIWEQLPLTANGKVDRGRLVAASAADQPAGTGGSGSDAPRTATEARLARILSETLGIDRVGIHDEFFELGGDSILGMQVVTRAAREGLRITARDLFLHPTIAELARTVADPAETAAAPGVTGEPAGTDDAAVGGGVDRPAGDPALVPLTPIQRWFFELELANPAHFNQSLRLVPVAGPLDADRLATAIVAALGRHDAPRLRYRRDPVAGWQQRYGDEDPVEVERIPVAGLAGTARRQLVERAAAYRNATLNLAEGPLVRVVLFVAGTECQELLIAVHHLAVDGVSWRIVLDDVATAYQGGTLAPARDGFGEYARALAGRADEAAVRDQVPHWERLLGGDAIRPAGPLAPGPEGQAVTVTRALDRETTTALLTRANAAYRTRTDELLLTALAIAVNRGAGPGAVRVDVEGHGRDGAGLADVVGWFTTITPVRLDLAGIEPDRDPGGALTRIRTHLRAVPGRPGDFGLLRYGRETGWPGGPQAVPPADILFNYLGRLEGIGAGLVRIADGQDGRSRDPGNRRPYPVEVDCWVFDGRFEVLWTVDGAGDRAGAERMAATFVAALADLVRHCTGADATGIAAGAGIAAGVGDAAGYRASDFPLAGLTDETLAAVIDTFRRAQPAASAPVSGTAGNDDEEGARRDDDNR